MHCSASSRSSRKTTSNGSAASESLSVRPWIREHAGIDCVPGGRRTMRNFVSDGWVSERSTGVKQPSVYLRPAIL